MIYDVPHDSTDQQVTAPAILHGPLGSPGNRRRLAGVVLVLLAAALYALTMDNGLRAEELVGGDLITHQYAQVQGRPSNAPGYPLYTMGGWLWYHGIRAMLVAAGVDAPNPIPILGSYSTIWALLSLWLLFQSICMTTESAQSPAGNWPVALLVGAFYAVTYFFWYYATTTEQYTSAIAQTLAIILVLLLWLRRQDSLWLLLALAFLSGLCLAHMLTVAFIVPPVVAAVLWTKPALLRQPKTVLASIAAALLPLTSYVFIYVRGSHHPEWWGSQSYESSTDWFWSFLSTSQGREELMWAFEPGRPFFGNDFPGLVGHELTWVVVIAGLAGIVYLRKPLPFVLYATLLIYVIFSWAYRFGNWFQVILPAYALLMLGVGALANRWQQFVVRRARSKLCRKTCQLASVIAWSAPIALLLVAIAWRFDASLPAADSRNRAGDTALDRAAVLLTSSLPPDSAVFASVKDALALQYLTAIWGIRPDVAVVTSQRAGDVLSQKPLFVTWEAAQMLAEEISAGDQTWLQPVSPDWLAVHAYRDQGQPPESSLVNDYVELDAAVLPGVRLHRYALSPAPNGEPVVRSPDLAYDLLLDWRLTQRNWPDDVSISVRPTQDGEYVVDPDNPGSIVLADHARPAQLIFGEGPQSDAGVADPYRIRFPARQAEDTGRRGVAVVLYRRLADGFEDILRLDLPVTDGQ